ncbi:MAG: hypothetical protein QN120_05250 [Armatimonadota bacterium]|nr:hypothetical protein [Armatimonadota bacterium]
MSRPETELIAVQQRGEWYWVRGRYRDRVLEVMVPVARERQEGERAFHRALATFGRAREAGVC